MKLVEFATKFPLSIATAVVAIILFAFGYIHSYNDPLVSFLVFELFVFVASLTRELRKVLKEKEGEIKR